MINYALPPASCGAVQLPLVHVHLDALRDNWNFLTSVASGQGANAAGMVAMIKADAYGHGLLPVAKTLLDAGARVFGVGTVAEAVCLRNVFGTSQDGGLRIIPMLGIRNVDEAAEAVANNLLPLVHGVRQIELLLRVTGGKTPLPVAVKVETGMARLGFRPHESAKLINALREAPGITPVMVLSHLAVADDPSRDDDVAAQVDVFSALYQDMRALWPDVTPSLANSPALLAHGALLGRFPGHAPRPGYALYGGNPLAGTARVSVGAALQPVMDVTAPVLAVHDLAAGESVSYGKTFTASGPMRVAVIGAGYADGFSRGLSGTGGVSLHGKRCPVLGRVCMQMHMVDVTHVPQIAEGDDAYILGGGEGGVSSETLAREWGTIPYEVWCILGRNAREYHGGSIRD